MRSPTVVFNSKMYTNATDITSILNKYFSSIDYKLSKVFGRVRKVVLPQIFTDTRFELKPVSTDFVLEKLRCLKANKAIDLDKISARPLKDASDVISPILTKFINLSIEQSNRKSAKVVALVIDLSTLLSSEFHLADR